MIFFHNWLKFRPRIAMSITIINFGWIILMSIVLFISMFIVSYSTKIMCSSVISSFIIVLLSISSLKSLQVIFCTRDPTHGIFLCLLWFFELSITIDTPIMGILLPVRWCPFTEWRPLGAKWSSCNPPPACLLTHLPLDKTAPFLQTIFSGVFSWMESFVVWLIFLWSLFLRVQLTITQHWFRPLSEPMMVRSLTHICITWPQWVKVYDPRCTTRASVGPSITMLGCNPAQNISRCVTLWILRVILNNCQYHILWFANILKTLAGC